MSFLYSSSFLLVNSLFFSFSFSFFLPMQLRRIQVDTELRIKSADYRHVLFYQELVHLRVFDKKEEVRLRALSFVRSKSNFLLLIDVHSRPLFALPPHSVCLGLCAVHVLMLAAAGGAPCCQARRAGADATDAEVLQRQVDECKQGADPANSARKERAVAVLFCDS